jgi:hypothetical protein
MVGREMYLYFKINLFANLDMEFSVIILYLVVMFVMNFLYFRFQGNYDKQMILVTVQTKVFVFTWRR